MSSWRDHVMGREIAAQMDRGWFPLILTPTYIICDGLVQDCSNSITNALELLQSCTKPLILVGVTLLYRVYNNPMFARIDAWDNYKCLKICPVMKLNFGIWISSSPLSTCTAYYLDINAHFKNVCKCVFKISGLYLSEFVNFWNTSGHSFGETCLKPFIVHQMIVKPRNGHWECSGKHRIEGVINNCNTSILCSCTESNRSSTLARLQWTQLTFYLSKTQ